MYISLRIALEILNYWQRNVVVPTLLNKKKIKENSYRIVPAFYLSYYCIPYIPEEKYVFEDKGKDQNYA